MYEKLENCPRCGNRKDHSWHYDAQYCNRCGYSCVGENHLYLSLTVENSGYLYHLLLREFVNSGLDPSKPMRDQLEKFASDSLILTAEVSAAAMERVRSLLLQIGEINDKLQGKNL